MVSMYKRKVQDLVFDLETILTHMEFLRKKFVDVEEKKKKVEEEKKRYEKELDDLLVGGFSEDTIKEVVEVKKQFEKDQNRLYVKEKQFEERKLHMFPSGCPTPFEPQNKRRKFTEDELPRKEVKKEEVKEEVKKEEVKEEVKKEVKKEY